MKISRTFDSLGGFVEAAAGSVADSNSASRRHRNRDDWDFGAGWDGSVRLAREGWPVGTAKVRELSGRVLRSVVGVKRVRRLEFDLAGEWWDVGRVIAGDPECGVNVRRRPGQAQVVRLVVSLAASAGVRAEDYCRRGAAVAAVVDGLEASGVRVEVVGGIAIHPRSGTGPKDDVYQTGVRLKAADEGLDLDGLSFALAHPAMLRRIWFGVAEREPEDVRERFGLGYRWDYGNPHTFEAEAEACSVAVLPMEDRTWQSDTAILDWVRAQVGAWVELDG